MTEDSIGGYFEIELANSIRLDFDSEIVFSSGRCAFAALLIESKIRHIQIPTYRCDALLEPLKSLGISYSFYSLSDSLMPNLQNGNLDITRPFLLINYFGVLENELKNSEILKMAIVDNTQALYSKVEGGLGAFNSYRKFLGICDGAEATLNGRKLLCNEDRYCGINGLNHLFGRF